MAATVDQIGRTPSRKSHSRSATIDNSRQLTFGRIPVNVRSCIRAVTVVLALGAAPAGLGAARQLAVAAGAATAPLTQTVPTDPRIAVGTLPNGRSEEHTS